MPMWICCGESAIRAGNVDLAIWLARSGRCVWHGVLSQTLVEVNKGSMSFDAVKRLVASGCPLLPSDYPVTRVELDPQLVWRFARFNKQRPSGEFVLNCLEEGHVRTLEVLRRAGFTPSQDELYRFLKKPRLITFSWLLATCKKVIKPEFIIRYSLPEILNMDDADCFEWHHKRRVFDGCSDILERATAIGAARIVRFLRETCAVTPTGTA